MKAVTSSVALALGLVGANAALAGGYTPAVVEPVVQTAPVVEAVPVGDWQGAYGGVTLGYAGNGDDRVGVWDRNGTLLNREIGNAKIKGLNGSLRVGYRWQKDKWVVGPELSVEGGRVKDDFTSTTYGDVESKLKNRVALTVKAGYEVQPNTIAYGIAGVSRGAFDYSLGTSSKSYDTNGYVLGVGIERRVNDRMSVTGEIEHNEFKDKRVFFDNGFSTVASPNYTNVKLGLNFKF